MKLHKFVAACALALSLGGAAQAASVVHLTGSTAFRKATIQAIENLMSSGPGGGSYTTGGNIALGQYRCAFVGSNSTAGNEQSATYVVLQGTIAGANNPVTIKCAWSGSVGGLYTTAYALNITNTNTGWLSAINSLSSTVNVTGIGNASCVGVATGNFTEASDTKTTPDVTMSDSLASSGGVTSNLTVAGAVAAAGVGVVPFEWVANNGVTQTVVFGNCSYTNATNTISYATATYPGNATANSTIINAAISALAGNASTGNVIFGGPNLPVRNAVVASITGNSTAGGVITLNATSTLNATVTANATTNKNFVGGLYGVNPINDINAQQARALLTSGGALLAQWTGNYTDYGTAVYAMGRNFDSGTRLSEMAETAVGVFTPLAHQLQPAFVGGVAYGSTNNSTASSSAAGKGGGVNQYIATLDKWKAESLYIGLSQQRNYDNLSSSGFNGGGDLAAALATPGSVGAGDSSVAGYQPFFNAAVGSVTAQTGGWLVGYLGWNDACLLYTSPSPRD